MYGGHANDFDRLVAAIDATKPPRDREKVLSVALRYGALVHDVDRLGRLTISAHNRDYQGDGIDERSLRQAELIEEAARDFDAPWIDPPDLARHCLWPKFYPELDWER
jgi:hypothetical protein